MSSIFTVDKIIDRIFEFNEEVVGVDRVELGPLEPQEKRWLTGALHEEATELMVARELHEQVDAVIDAAIFAIGGLRRMGLTQGQAQACFNAVLDANDLKAAGKKPGREGAKDAIKPEGWVPPEETIKQILAEEDE
jgi:predicted HAD superfamily Cof-like phosphohydrolase